MDSCPATTEDIFLPFAELARTSAATPDLFFIPISTLWLMLYDQGKARYKPRIKGRRRKRRRK